MMVPARQLGLAQRVLGVLVADRLAAPEGRDWHWRAHSRSHAAAYTEAFDG